MTVRIALDVRQTEKAAGLFSIYAIRATVCQAQKRPISRYDDLRDGLYTYFVWLYFNMVSTLKIELRFYSCNGHGHENTIRPRDYTIEERGVMKRTQIILPYVQPVDPCVFLAMDIYINDPTFAQTPQGLDISLISLIL